MAAPAAASLGATLPVGRPALFLVGDSAAFVTFCFFSTGFSFFYFSCYSFFVFSLDFCFGFEFNLSLDIESFPGFFLSGDFAADFVDFLSVIAPLACYDFLSVGYFDLSVFYFSAVLGLGLSDSLSDAASRDRTIPASAMGTKDTLSSDTSSTD